MAKYRVRFVCEYEVEASSIAEAEEKGGKEFDDDMNGGWFDPLCEVELVTGQKTRKTPKPSFGSVHPRPAATGNKKAAYLKEVLGK